MPHIPCNKMNTFYHNAIFAADSLQGLMEIWHCASRCHGVSLDSLGMDVQLRIDSLSKRGKCAWH